MEKLKVKGIKRENSKVILTLLEYEPAKFARIFKGFSYEVIEDESPVIEIKCSKRNEKKLTKILNEKIEFIKLLESRFKQYELISTVDNLEIHPQGLLEIDAIAAPIQDALVKLDNRFEVYVGGRKKVVKAIRPEDFTKTFRYFVKQDKPSGRFYLRGKSINLGFRNNKFILSGEKIRPATKFFMKNG
jgi:hypothetical protein